jgi:hypothetical protein
MKTIKQLLSEISYGPKWDPKAFSRDMFKAYLGRKFDPNVDTDIVRPTIHPHVAWLKDGLTRKNEEGKLYKTIAYHFRLPSTPKGEHEFLDLPVQDIHHDPENKTITVSVDSTEYHNHLRDAGISHSQATNIKDVQDIVSSQLFQPVKIKGITEYEGDDYSGAPDTLHIHLDEDSVLKAHQRDIQRRSDFDDRDEYYSGPEDFQI